MTSSPAATWSCSAAIDGVVLQLGQVVRAELVEVLRRELEPAGEGIAADDGGAEGVGFHERGSGLRV